MAQEQTVQGAAKKISGLLNPNKGQSDPEKKQNHQNNLKRSNRKLHQRVNQSLKELLKKMLLKIPKSKKKRKQQLMNPNSTELKYKVKS